ncbi:MAG: twin-arginine translocase TatA/TatE family subunit [Candidatus Daviesbacteria bacterium]
MFQSIGVTEWLVIALVLILLFGSKRISGLFKSLGEAVREFNKASKDSPQSDE